MLPVLPLAAQNNSDGSRHIRTKNEVAVQKKKAKDNIKKVIMPFYNGLFISGDLYGIGAKLLGSDFLSSEIGLSVNLRNRYMPVVEIGYGETNTSNENGIHYKTGAPYFRIGIDYNMRWKKVDYDDVLFLGLRYGYTSFKYDVNCLSLIDPIYGGEINNPILEDPIWGGSNTYNHPGMNGSMSWYELVGGIRTKIFKNVYMGLSLRLKYRLGNKMDVNAQPWYVPGFGKFDAKATGISYTIIYKFSVGTKKPVVIMPVSDDNKPINNNRAPVRDSDKNIENN